MKELQSSRILALLQVLTDTECAALPAQVLAYRFTFITSVQLLNSFTIPCVFIL